MATVLDAPRRAEQPERLALANLHLGARELAAHLTGTLERGDALDAFLLAAGLHQMVEDAAERDRLRLADAHRVLSGPPRAAAGAAARALAALSGARDAAGLASLVDDLADCVIAGGRMPSAELGEVPELPGRVLRLPACFRGFDQHPDDVRRLVASFAAEFGDRDRPVAVVGVRTSGSYLAPLTASALRADGYSDAIAMTVRPSHPIARGKRRLLRDVLRAGGIAVVVDDPPASGDSIARVAEALRSLGRDRGLVIPMFALHAGGAVPEALAGHACVTLPWERWSIHDRLAPKAIARALERLWGDERVGDVTRLPLDDSHARGHVSARYRVEVGGPEPEVRDVFVRGVGLGYLGRHVEAVAARLEPWVPRPYGVVDGLAFRAWVPDELTRAPSAPDVAAYAATRQRLLPVETDPASRLAGQDPVWEVASNILSGAFARGWRPMRIVALDRVTRELLQTRTPCVVDGYMHASAWFDGPLKTKSAERAFSNRNLACSDAAYDLAASAALGDLDPRELRSEFARESGELIDDERWLVYELVAAWAARRDGVFDAGDEARASARALRRYLASLFLDDLPPVEGGELCALDVDGVLETETLGFPGPSPASLLALRALRAHGYRPVLASGRSASEIAERCADYGLAGGVAEYGAAVVLGGVAQGLVSPGAAAAVERARALLERLPGVEIGSRHDYTIRASRRDPGGRRVALRDDDVRAVLAEGPLRAVPGESQTDVVPNEVNKASALRVLAERLGCPDAGLALAVGDAVEDVPLLQAAALAIAPANADAAVRAAGIRLARRPYQAGLAEAVGKLIGHAAGGCPACAPAPRERRTKLLLGVLAARERGPRGLVAQALRTTWRAHAAR